MRTAIIYASKTGTTRDCANLLKDKLSSDVQLIDLKTVENPNVADYDKIIVGSAIYMGRPLKEVVNFCMKNKEILLHKHISFFFCGLETDERIKADASNYIAVELMERASIIDYFGGELHHDKVNFIDKFIMKQMEKTLKVKTGIRTEEIEKFAEEVE